ncbi:Endogenous retrovirus group K member 113 Pol protein [Lonchura striata]|uniref:Endogenous retrovirus group K member 113 Pol protein n=1 Tax=Lonchura striata TaxID=40157 RepID=A0A218V292_9PASE|nr:Endogenous retrovirus group K member 113 Pol protein [Lonchura striata domestica]
MAFQRFSQVPLSLVTDSAYVAGITKRLDCSLLKEVNNAVLFQLLRALWCAFQDRVHPYYILHIRSHTKLPHFVTEGNARADRLANPAWVAPQPDRTAQAKASHQSAHTLQKQFDLTATEARDIVSSCADCHGFAAHLPVGVNPRGLKALQLWQTDVTHIAKVWVQDLVTNRGRVHATSLLGATGMHVSPEVAGYDGYLRRVFALT